ncbi:glutathione peroxidase [Anaerobacillus alkalidiazotrophicus]|uniref:Glutathione peroxidase n=1 Tax=Anaerobacillus alkalidiazotrophicus TaxID=472963 RepID=A0A1S2M6N5_9BACI|nr:glutathione peroxidase [Anaerobacillus alkalidiazotrophicus]OIJ19437.1 glutathione peroxidase [Anaerobacillus alkalidiazotrophicus]
MSIYKFSALMINGENKSLADYEGKVLLIVNTATKCGFAPQFNELQKLYDTYKDNNFEVLGFPSNQFMNQEPGTNEEMAERCKLNFGVTFTLFKKVDVKGDNAHPLFNYLTKETKGILTPKIKWNFTKFLINKNGNVVKRYGPTKSPLKIKEDIKNLLK